MLTVDWLCDNAGQSLSTALCEPQYPFISSTFVRLVEETTDTIIEAMS